MPQCTDMQGKSVTSHHKSEAAMSKDSNLPRTHKSQFGAHIHGHGHGTWNMTIGIRLTCACTCTCNVYMWTFSGHASNMQGQGSRVLLRPYILVKRSTRLRRLHAGLTPLPLSLSSDDRLTFRHETCVPGVLAAPCCRPTHRPSSRARRRGPPRARAKLKPYKPRNMKYPDYAYGKPQNNAWVRLNYYLCRGLAPHTRRSPPPAPRGFCPAHP